MNNTLDGRGRYESCIKKIMKQLSQINNFNALKTTGDSMDRSALTAFCYAGNHLGFIDNRIVELLTNETNTRAKGRLHFKLNESSLEMSLVNESSSVESPPSIASRDKPISHLITSDLEEIIKSWQPLDELKNIIGPSSWRNERFNVYGLDANQCPSILFEVERSAIGLFGLMTYGCHCNVYVLPQLLEGNLKERFPRMWIAKRSQSKATHPGFLDNCAAGGLASKDGITPLQTMIKECEEEAGIDILYSSRNLKPVGMISFHQSRHESRESEPGTDYCFDLEVPSSFVPIPRDGEVESFQLLSLHEILQIILDDDPIKRFKPESMLVILDFLIRWGFISCEEPGYLELCLALKRPLPFPSRP